MSTTLNASTSSGLVQSADTSGTLELQSNGTTKLTISSSGVNIGQMNGGALTSGTSVTASGTSVDFTSIPSWVKRVTVMLSGISTNGTSLFLVQLGDSGGVETTGYASGAGSRTGETSSTAGFVLNPAGVAALSFSGSVQISTLGSNLWVTSGVLSRSDGFSNGFGGNKTLSDTLDRVRITMVNGTDTFDAGTINIIYEG